MFKNANVVRKEQRVGNILLDWKKENKVVRNKNPLRDPLFRSA